jgi:carboxyl-terminal processing protease
VLDGGGVDPDLKTENRKYSSVLYALFQSDYIFDFATQYTLAHKEAINVQNFKFTDADYDAFVEYVKDKKLTYKTESETFLDSLENVAKEEHYSTAIANEIADLRTKIKHDKKQDLLKNKADISRTLAREIISRYAYTQGRIHYSILDDEDVKAATNALLNKSTYIEILTKK